MGILNMSKRDSARVHFLGPTGRCLLMALCSIVLISDAFAQSSATNDGDAAHKADVARQNFGVKGLGAKVCVISDSIDDAAGSLAKAQHPTPPAVAAVPASIDILPNQAGTGTGEGLGMLEIIHKIAPDASLGFATSGQPANGDIEDIMSRNIRDLAGPNHNCKIILDDYTGAGDVPFQDGKRAIAINEVTANGVLYISSAGNYGNKKKASSATWEGDFLDSDATPTSWPDVGRRHDFGGGNRYVTLTAPTTQIGLYWSDPWSGATEKYKMYLNRPSRGFTVSIGDSDKPREYLFSQVSGFDCPSHHPAQPHCFDVNDRIYIVKADVPVPGTTPSSRPSEPRFLRLDTFYGEINLGTNGSSYGHSAAENALTVAAANMPSSGAFTGAATIARRSSDGPRRIFFSPNSAPINKLVAGPNKDGGQVIDKPDLAAAACATTVWPGTDASKPNVFCGTSAAAPYVAGIAALILSKKPEFTAAQVKQILIASAIRIEDQTKPWNDVSGYGIPMADKALELADKPSIYTWVSATAPPVNVVTAPEAAYRAVCRGKGEYGRPWVGFWDGRQCLGSYSGNIMPATDDIQFLTAVQSAQKWVEGTGKIIPGDIGILPPNAINAGNTYGNRPQVLCSMSGYIGWAYHYCAIGAQGLSVQEKSTLLVGTVQ